MEEKVMEEKNKFDLLIYRLIKNYIIMKYLKRFNESREEREGTFDYFMTKSKEELIDYQKNFQHSFENPAEHDPKYVAWKKACELKKCFPKEETTKFGDPKVTLPKMIF